MIMPDYNGANTALQNIITHRVPLLAPDASVVGARLSDANVFNDSQPVPLVFPQVGTYAGETGPVTYRVPNVALRIRVDNGPLNRATRWLHYLPNTQFAGSGALNTSNPWLQGFNAYKIACFAASLSMARRSAAGVAPSWVFMPVVDMNINGVSTRKIGRPFGLPRGRQRIR